MMKGDTRANSGRKPWRMRVYGLTGGTASGKSEAAKRFAELGIPIIDADKAGHEAIEPGGAAAELVLNAFGEEICTDGRIDRAKLGAIVFSDETARERLNAIVHPVIKRWVEARCRALADEGHRMAMVDAALLAESGKRETCLSGLILVTCDRATRLRRLVELRGLRPEEAGRRIDAQTPPEKKIALADWVIENEGSIEELRGRVDEVMEELERHGR